MKRNTLRPFPAVTLVLGETGGYRRVNSVHQVAELLLEHWPVESGEEYVTAVRICLEAMLGAVPPEAARDALIRAAREAGLSVMQ
ncbi:MULTISPECIES: DUF982 domain-containing protein [Rhizobium]|uniref:DUF982 domain-containing protein n=1 Tax=Rhizobium lusitanum TaxID=293958 RepID=A0A1C3URP5_9HYPH|nr:MULTISPECIES: DUF982 domain-containing protein [Rhizobium]NRP86618.1 hypothetical protein [Ensifer adhaerens]NKJ03508.1 hypothetical protein [Rhizobium sp. SG741]NKJ33644.1 hypothetical protein [Rhizobium sp. SG570]NTJ08118.1 DUF982 domain-containing protein [Rhizobium lusitanum]SCB18125.1 Protein of unknown function [Rhizobium lusitanum]